MIAIEFRDSRLDWSRPYIMGVLNLTPDSFSDGGRFVDLQAALQRAEQLVADGADIIDIGGESTRPNAPEVDAQAECDRVLEVIEILANRISVPISVDTSKSLVARLAVQAGAEIVNDISGGAFDQSMIATVTQSGAAFVCGHVRGQSLSAAHSCAEPSFSDVANELAQRIDQLPLSLRGRTIADPCLGFGKGLSLNIELMNRSKELSTKVGRPVLMGPSRKRFLGLLCEQPVDKRDPATVGACLAAVQRGAHLLRVHNVAMTAQALRVYNATVEPQS